MSAQEAVSAAGVASSSPSLAPMQLQSASKSPALAPIKVLAPLAAPTAQAATNDEHGGSEDGADTASDATTSNSTSSPPAGDSAGPPVLALDSDEPDAVAKAKGEHLLHQRWTFWYDLKDVGKATASNWGMSLKKLMDFESVEQFWGMINNIAKPSALPVGSDYHCFKFGVKPEWEDPENRAGGKWVWELRKNEEVEMDKAWINTVRRRGRQAQTAPHRAPHHAGDTHHCEGRTMATPRDN